MKKIYIVILKTPYKELTTSVESWCAWMAGIKAVVLNYDLGFTFKDIVGIVDNNT